MALVTLAVTSAMANTEIDLNYYLMPVISRTVKYPNSDYKETWSYPAFFGLESNFNFFFGKNAGIFDVGLNLDVGFHAVTGKVKIKDNNGNVSTNPDPFSGVGGFLSLGPVFRFTPVNIVSVTLIPGLQFGADWAVNNINKDYKEAFIDYNVAFSFNAAAKIWLLNKTGFHLGLNVGADVDIPFAGGRGYGYYSNVLDWDWGYTGTGEYDPRYSTGVNFRIFVGIAFQFGDRAFDRQ